MHHWFSIFPYLIYFFLIRFIFFLFCFLIFLFLIFLVNIRSLFFFFILILPSSLGSFCNLWFVGSFDNILVFFPLIIINLWFVCFFDDSIRVRLVPLDNI